MNDKFYALSEEKQSRILNAAYKVFAMNQYKKAPTSEIAAEAGISKSLLFHYFHNKQASTTGRRPSACRRCRDFRRTEVEL